MNNSVRSFFGLIKSFMLLGVVLGLGFFSVPAAVFNANAATLGAIPDGGITATCGSDGANKDITFTVSGIPTAPANVAISMTFLPIHTWRADLGAVLIAPNGTQFILYKYIGAITAGSCGGTRGGNDFAGPYNFKDSAVGTNIWSEAGNPTTSGDYRTTAAGGAGQVDPAPVTNLTAAFSGIPTSNGTWTLRMTDGGLGDTGSVSAATLTLTSPTAAGVTVSGRVVTSEGRGLRSTNVLITDPNGNTRRVLTGAYGSFQFDDVEVGQTYVISVGARRFNFTPQVLQISDNISDLVFTANQ